MKNEDSIAIYMVRIKATCQLLPKIEVAILTATDEAFAAPLSQTLEIKLTNEITLVRDVFETVSDKCILNSNSRSTAPLSLEGLTHNRICVRGTTSCIFAMSTYDFYAILGNFTTTVVFSHDVSGKFLRAVVCATKGRKGLVEEVPMSISGAFGVVHIPDCSSKVKEDRHVRVNRPRQVQRNICRRATF